MEIGTYTYHILENDSILCLISLLTGFVCVNWVYFKILLIAKSKNLVDNPNARKLQIIPIPVLGGIAVFFGVLGGLMMGCSLVVVPSIARGIAITMPLAELTPVLCAMGVMLYTGALDDIIGLSPTSRMVLESFAVIGMIMGSGMCIDSFHGLWGVGFFTWRIAIPLTIFAGIGIVNAINMIDGVNGLSSGMCIACCLCYGISFYHVGDVMNAILAFSVVGALIPFFIHNVFGLKSRMFIGDAGTMVMGIIMTWFTISMVNINALAAVNVRLTHVGVAALALAILSVPIADTLRVMVMRIIHGLSPFNPDRTHLHHAFINVGISHSVTALTEIAMDMLTVVAWYISKRLGASYDQQLYIVIGVAGIMVWGSYIFLWYHREYKTNTYYWLITKVGPATHMGKTKWWKHFTAILDAPEERMLAKRKAKKS